MAGLAYRVAADLDFLIRKEGFQLTLPSVGQVSVGCLPWGRQIRSSVGSLVPCQQIRRTASRQVRYQWTAQSEHLSDFFFLSFLFLSALSSSGLNNHQAALIILRHGQAVSSPFKPDQDQTLRYYLHR